MALIEAAAQWKLGLPDANMVPDSPPPVAPEVNQPQGLGPLRPEPLIPMGIRVQELDKHLVFLSTIGDKTFTPQELDTILKSQALVEKNAHDALISAGVPVGRILEKQNEIREWLFYPRGTCYTLNTYQEYENWVKSHGIRTSVPYRRVAGALGLPNPEQ